MNTKKILFVLCIAVFLITHSYHAEAISIGISPGRVKFDGVLRGGYSERIVTLSTGGEDELAASFKAQGEIKDWLKFDPNSTTLTISKGKPFKLKVIVQPPSDIRIGNYSGSIEFVTEAVGGGPGRAGALVKTAVTLLVNVEVTGKQTVSCRAGAFTFNDAEIGFPFEFSYDIINDGNVRLKPVVTFDIWDQMQEKLLLTKDVTGDEVLPTTERKITGMLTNTLAENQYWVNMKIDTCKSSSLATFSVVEKGGIIDKGELREILNKPWAQTNETVQITAKFQNTGKRSVSAKFKGAIRLDDRIVKLIETDEVIVPIGESSDFDIFFAPQLPGRYTIAGRVIYNKKLTYMDTLHIFGRAPAVFPHALLSCPRFLPASSCGSRLRISGNAACRGAQKARADNHRSP